VNSGGRERLQRRLEDVAQWAPRFARLVGAPVVEAAHFGRLDCRDRLFPLRYRSQIGDGARICAGDGAVLASRDRDEGPEQ
jgi:hypothetical protein